MRIAVLMPYPHGHPNPEENAEREERIRARVSPGTTVEIGYLEKNNTHSQPFNLDHKALIIAEVAEMVERAARSAPDAIVVYGGLDPGVLIARERVAVPVIAVGQAGYAVAAQLGLRLGVLVYEQATIEPIWRLARTYHAEHVVANIRTIGVPLPELYPRRPDVRRRIVEVARECIEQDGATAIFAQGMSMVPSAMSARELEQAVGVPALDGLEIALHTAEMIAGFTQTSRVRAPGAPTSV
jgi:Asp/Glu/hydantoin racemase